MVHRYRAGRVPGAELDPELVADLEPIPDEVARLLDGAELTAALDVAWQAVRRLNRYVEERAPWALAKDEARAGELDRVLATLAEGLRATAVLLHPWLPASSATLLAALGAPDLGFDGARLRAGKLGEVERLAPLFPKHD
jgi:methionyl-tRNA synthetase